MSRTTSTTTALRLAVSAAVATFGLITAAHASALRTFVSGAGDDANAGINCPLANPCRSFAGAYAVTSSGGEIIAIDSAGYGSLTITGPVTIMAAAIASVPVTASSTGITITAGSGDKVILRNLQITGNGASSSTGIKVNSGRLVLKDSSLRQLTTGLSVTSSKVDVIDTDFIGNTTAIFTSGQGSDTNCNPSTFGPMNVRLSGGNLTDNTTAYFMHDPGFGSGNNCNRITIFVRDPNNVYSVNQTGNTTLVTGDGTSCTSNVNFCTTVGTYLPGVNQQLN